MLRKHLDRHRKHLTWVNLLLVVLLAAAVVALWISNDVGSPWTVGNYR